jgi:hypothetical protein
VKIVDLDQFCTGPEWNATACLRAKSAAILAKLPHAGKHASGNFLPIDFPHYPSRKNVFNMKTSWQSGETQG